MLVISGKEVLTTLEELVTPKHSALLLIDLQNDYIVPGGYTDKLGGNSSAVAQIIPRIKGVLEAARRNGVLVIHVQMTLFPNFVAESPACLRGRLLLTHYKGGEPFEKLPTRCIEGTRGWQIVDELTPLPNEIVVKKQRTSAFMGTNMDTVLRSNGIKSVTIVGIATSGCVLATAIHATLLDYYPIVLRDCVAVGMPEPHNAALLVMSQYMDVLESEEVLKIWR